MSNGSPPYRAVDAAVGVILVIATVALFLHLTATDGEFSRYNHQWNGTSEVFDAFEDHGLVMVSDPAVLKGERNRTLLVISPARAPTAEEQAAYREFVAAGNTLVLADDFGSGNELLKAVGTSVRFDHGKLSSISRKFEISTAPLGYPVAHRSIVWDISKVVFNHPVAVSGGEPLINTTPLSWVDTDGDGKVDLSEPLDSFTVMTDAAVGTGRVVAIGDASLFINAMQGLPDCDNDLLIENLIAGETLVDQRLSRTAVVEGPISTFLWVSEIPSLVVVVTALTLGVVAWWLKRRNG